MKNKSSYENISERLLTADNVSNHNFRRRLFTAILSISGIFAIIFSIMHDLRINILNDFHANVNYVYAVCCIVIIILFKKYPDRFRLYIFLFLIASHITFTSALINVVDDQFRAIWLYFLVLIAYMLAGRIVGITTTAIVMCTLLVINQLNMHNFSSITFTSILFGLIILSALSQVYTGRAIHHAKLLRKQNKQLEQLANEDSLTGIMNARSYYQVGHRLFELARRRKKDMSLLYIDIDHFKNINDEYGHYAGDQVLIAITKIIGDALRKSDVFARIGGEEFCIILADTELDGARVLAEKIRKAIEVTEIHLESNDLFSTASIGIASINKEDVEMKNVQLRADANMYLAKQAGRNQVVY